MGAGKVRSGDRWDGTSRRARRRGTSVLNVVVVVVVIMIMIMIMMIIIIIIIMITTLIISVIYPIKPTFTITFTWPLLILSTASLENNRRYAVFLTVSGQKSSTTP